jgi:hypothetical protein
MRPVVFRWDGNVMVPLERFRPLCREQYMREHDYRLAPVEFRSRASHDHYFASVAEAWQQLPEYLTDRFPTEDHLRRFALCMTGYYDERSIACSSKAEARRIAAFITPMDTYAVVVVREAVVNVLTAKSQSRNAMGKKAFQDSKDKVLDYVWRLCGLETPPSRNEIAQGRNAA